MSASVRDLLDGIRPTTGPAPIAIRVVRHACPFCHRSRSKRQATVEHIGRCWLNPDNRTCKTCANFVPAESEPDVGYFADEDCAAGVALTGAVVTGCGSWEATP